MSNNLYEIIEELNSTSLYYYIFVITFSIILFNSKKIELNNILGFVFWFYDCSLFISKKKKIILIYKINKMKLRLIN